MRKRVFTIGHSTHPLEIFIDLLMKHGITVICDVRSAPHSRLNPQYNQENLKLSLNEHGITYVFLGKELGARSDDPNCYEHGKIQYERLAHTESFRAGLERVKKGTKKYSVALMCAEKEPLECHRAVLVARHLEMLDFEIQHIHSDGSLESQLELVQRLLHLLNLPENSMFRSREEIVADAYRIQGERIAYTPSKAPHKKANPASGLFP
ncbi:MAG TPA: DUF488 domain-containing protein [Candidatus Baltobacteraceae bacterium]|jgi:uncharacterized protein (DUF488 family)|nr:DUF488 domain-containing protein [Candidatus Baltobacteraceae bacterium]